METLQKRNIASLWDLGELPFHIGPKSAPTNETVPDMAPFQIGLDEELKLLVQFPDLQIETLMEKAYQAGSQIGTPMDEGGLGKQYCDDFLSFALASSGHASFDGLQILEIGCGNGYLLKCLKEQGAQVIGVEPGIASPYYAKRENITILNQPFDKSVFTQKFDLIFHYGVLEHVSDPLSFLSDQKELLSPNGRIVFSVPDCTDYFLFGDLSMFIHEHWSYFTKNSLSQLCQKSGLAIQALQRGGIGGVLYTSANLEHQTVNCPQDMSADPQIFIQKAQHGLRALQSYFSHNPGTHGIYCPGRFINYQYMLNLENTTLRYFDDDPHLHGKFFPPFPIAVESRQDLLTRPVNHLLIMSRTFGPKLASSLRQNNTLSDCTISLIEEILP